MMVDGLLECFKVGNGCGCVTGCCLVTDLWRPERNQGDLGGVVVQQEVL